MFSGRARIILLSSKVEGNIWRGRKLYPEADLIAVDPKVIAILKNKHLGDVIDVLQVQLLNRDAPIVIKEVL